MQQEQSNKPKIYSFFLLCTLEIPVPTKSYLALRRAIHCHNSKYLLCVLLWRNSYKKMAENKKQNLDKITVRGAHTTWKTSALKYRETDDSFTGLSGSGNPRLPLIQCCRGSASLRRSLSAYATILNQMRSDVDEITSLSPSISIDQKSHSSNPRSTVATVPKCTITCVFFMRASASHCLVCGTEINVWAMRVWIS